MSTFDFPKDKGEYRNYQEAIDEHRKLIEFTEKVISEVVLIIVKRFNVSEDEAKFGLIKNKEEYTGIYKEVLENYKQ